MRIVICDDDRQELERLQKVISDHLRQRIGFVYTLIPYQNSRQLLFDLEDKARADLYILDIDMPQASGIEIADRLKDMTPNHMLFFYTAHSEFATEGYRVEARRYILKDRPAEQLYEALDFACDEFEKKKQDCVSFRFNRDVINVPAGEIMYVCREGRQCSVHTQNHGVLWESTPIKTLFSRIQRPGFLFIDKGVFINVDFVHRTQNNEVIMFDGKTFMISRRRIAEVKDAIMIYWREI